MATWLALPSPLTAQPADVPSSSIRGNPQTILQEAVDAQEVFNNLFSGIWDRFLTTDSPIFSTLLSVLTPIVALGFALYVLASVWAWQKSNFKSFPWQRLYLPLVVVFLFANGGELTIASLQGYRNLVYDINRQILSADYFGQTGADLLRNKQIDETIRDARESGMTQCNEVQSSNGDEAFQECLADLGV